ncbi:Mycothiol acetyltransferase [bioreactor metagenome]|uniref:Mycothiol acetyltransferase n=1 Tax=bioreactor metagenome TaxID=1076179 RepID=A0A644Z2K8_9ZZZZ
MADSFKITQATQQDISSISTFLETANFVHRHLDWQPLIDWVGSQPFLLLQNQLGAIEAILALPPDPPQIAWVHCFACSAALTPNLAWQLLFPTALALLSRQNVEPVAVGLEEWFTQLLLLEGFSIQQKIVVLLWDHHLPPAIPLPAQVMLRPMEPQDIPEVASLDAAAFEKIWANSENSIRLAYLQAERSTVAEQNGRIIGYEISTSSQYTAHLARLAVLPEFRHQQIGKALVREMLAHFSRHGKIQVTVNTQNDNQASLHLYKNLGFEFTGEDFPVLKQ